MFEEDTLTPHRVVGLVMHLLREIRENRLNPEDIELISDDLIGQGYTESEINTAFSWIFARLDGVEPSEVLFQGASATTAFRILHPAEKAVLKPDAQGQLLGMYEMGLLTLEDVERLIERAMAFGGPLTGDEVRMMVHQYIFEDGNQSFTNGIVNFLNPSMSIH